MADETTTTAAENQVETATANETTEQEPVEEFDKDRALETIRKQREQEKALKGRLKELEQAKAKLDQIEDAQRSETEKLAKRAEEAETRLREMESEMRLLKATRAAAAAGAVDPDLVADRIPAEALGDERALEAAIADLKQRYPRQFAQTTGAGSVDAGQRANGTHDPGFGVDRLRYAFEQASRK